MVFRVYVEKKPGFDVEAQQLGTELKTILGIDGLRKVRIVNRYDVEGISQELFEQATPTVFSEPQVDDASADLPDFGDATVFATEFLPGQFDQRADSAAECIQLISQGERPTVRSAKVYALEGTLSEADVDAIKHYVINPVEAREASLEAKTTLKTQVPTPGKVETIAGFNEMDAAAGQKFIDERGLAMDLADLEFCQKYFSEEGREPTITEIKVIDTYWSDHCRHTTFGTELDEVDIDDAAVKAAFERYLEMRHELGRDAKPVCLMDMGTIGAKWLKKNGILTGLDESEEINACTVKVKVDVNGEDEDWLFLFKNETHNHPTEIEPFGGAATCIGGCIRDPLSGRSYVYQAMRVTGAADPTVPVSETLEGKLPQRKLVTTAAAGYSSYGNQIGLATGQVDEIYHPGYVAKRMEVGAVVAATPADHVRRETPAPGDRIILLGGRTGRDGMRRRHRFVEGSQRGVAGTLTAPKCRRATRPSSASCSACSAAATPADSSSAATTSVPAACPWRSASWPTVCTMDLNTVPKKYEGLDGTELAISESQERMAVDVAAEDVDEFLGLRPRGEPRSHGDRHRDRGPAHGDDLERRQDREPEPRVPGVQRRLQASGRARRGAGGVRGARLVARRLAGRPHERRSSPTSTWHRTRVCPNVSIRRSEPEPCSCRSVDASSSPRTRPWSPSSLCSARPRPLRPWRGASTRTSCRRTSSPAHTCRSSSRCRSWSRPVSNTRRRT